MITVLPHPAPPKEAHLAAARKGDQQVDNLDAGLENVDLRILLGEGRGRTMNGHFLVRNNRPKPVHRPTDHVHDPPEGRFARPESLWAP
jgi:hypothetical protein